VVKMALIFEKVKRSLLERYYPPFSRRFPMDFMGREGFSQPTINICMVFSKTGPDRAISRKSCRSESWGFFTTVGW